MPRGRPKKDATANAKKTKEQIQKEKVEKIKADLRAKEEIRDKAEQEAAVLKAQLKIEELDEQKKTEFLKKQDEALNFIRCIYTLDGIDDVLDKLGIEVTAEGDCECETTEERTESVDGEGSRTLEENT